MKRNPGLNIRIIQGDITKFTGDAVVNAANPSLLGGGGVDGAIHRAAGPGLREECEKFPVTNGVRCEISDVKVTGGHDLNVHRILHTVGPVFERQGKSRPGEILPDDIMPEVALVNTYLNCLKTAKQHDIYTIAFPAISCGIYGCPITTGAFAAASACLADEWDMDEITFVMFTDHEYHVYMEIFKALNLL